MKHYIIPFALLALMTACGGNNMCMEGSRRAAARLTNNSFHFPGGHTPTEQEVKTWYAPLAKKMLAGGRINRLALAMIDYNNGDPKRILD